MRKATMTLFAFLASFFAIGAAHAQTTFDVTSVTTAFDSVATAMAGIGAAIALAAVIAVGWKWVKGAIFG